MGAVALIPARAGSTRVPGKNIRPLAGQPLIAYSIAAAIKSGLFDAVVVSTDSEEIASVARSVGAEVPALRPASLAGPRSPDIEWVTHTLGQLRDDGREFELFSILRPTSPFRGVATIRRAWQQLMDAGAQADSIRAVQPCREHPGKMWILDGDRMRPLLSQRDGEVPTHSRQYQDLPEVHVQNSSLEIARTRLVGAGEIAGSEIVPFFTDGAEGLTIDYPEDWAAAERLVADGTAPLPVVRSTVADRSR
ncbi:MAG: cytidylyltransferase domain-containing protein [Solirubrobacterales bacterium]